MKVVAKGSFDRDTDRIRNKELRLALDKKIVQIERAKNISQITGVKLLRGYTNHYRIIVKTQQHTYRIGSIIRGGKVWLVRFLPRRIVYKRFP